MGASSEMEKNVDQEGVKNATLRSTTSDTALSEKTDVELSIDPEEACFASNGAGKTDHMVVNFTKTRLALKAKCSNNELFRVNPVFQVIEAGKCKNICITRTPGPPSKKPDKVLVVYHTCDEKVTDLKAFFKELEAKNQDVMKYVKIGITTDGGKKVGKKTLLRSFCTEGDDESIWTSLTVDDEKVLVEGTVSNGWKEGMEKEFDAVALVFSTTELDSFEYTLEMQNEIQKVAERMPVVFIENKVDVVEESQLDKSTVEGEMKKRRKRLYRVSATKEFNVMHPFAYLIEKLTRHKKDENANERKQSASVNNPPVSPPKPSIEAWVEPVPAAPAVSAVHKKDKCTLM